MSELEKIIEKINTSKSILLLTHEDPDGDAIGSSLGLMHGLKKLDKEATVLIPHPDKTYTFLPGYEEIKNEIENVKDYDLCISLDCSDLERLNSCKNYFKEIDNTIVIDHHITNQNYGDVNYVNAVSSSTCQNIIIILAALEVSLNKEIATCIYAGMLTDTGGFRYNMQPETFEFAAMLFETGIDVAKIYRTLFDLTNERKIRLLGKALNRLELLEEGKVAFTYITNADVEEIQSEEGDQENIVNYGRNIEGVEVSVFIRQKNDKYKVSMRSNEYVDVSRIASKFAGGGHIKAAGFDISMSLEQTKQTIINEIKKNL